MHDNISISTIWIWKKWIILKILKVWNSLFCYKEDVIQYSSVYKWYIYLERIVLILSNFLPLLRFNRDKVDSNIYIFRHSAKNKIINDKAQNRFVWQTARNWKLEAISINVNWYGVTFLFTFKTGPKSN